MKTFFHLLVSDCLLAISVFNFVMHLMVRWNILSRIKFVLVWQDILMEKNYLLDTGLHICSVWKEPNTKLST
jgi:hypothetical protein